MSDKARVEKDPRNREPKKRKHPEEAWRWESDRESFRKVSRPRPRSAK